MKRNSSKARSGDRGDMNLVYTDMSGHYRRLLNAKAVVDTSPPRCYVPRRSPQRHKSSAGRKKSAMRRSRIDEDTPTPSDLELLDQIVYDKRHGPSEFYRDSKRNIHWPAGHDICRQERNSKTHSYKQQSYSKKPSSFKVPVYTSGKQGKLSPNRPPPRDIMDLHADSFESPKQNKPRILKSDANSRVRDLNVYHPPRRRSKKSSVDSASSPTRRSKKSSVDGQSSPPMESVSICEPEVEWILSEALSNKTVEKPKPDKPFKECFCEDNPEPSSKMSIGSHDSAYIGSGGESRGVSPEQTSSKSPSMGSAGESRGTSPEQTSSKSPSMGSAGESRGSSPEQTLAQAPVEGSTAESNALKKKPEVKSGGLFACFGKSSAKETQSEEELENKGSGKLMDSQASTKSLGNQRSTVLFENKGSMDSLNSMKLKRMMMMRQDNQKDDFRYATFSHEITQDILLRGIFSDNGLNAVFNRHIQENEHLLEMDKMKKEVSFLRLQLGVPEQTTSATSLRSKSSPVSSNLSVKTRSSLMLSTNASREGNESEPESNGVDDNVSLSSNKMDEPTLEDPNLSPTCTVSQYLQDESIDKVQFCNNVSDTALDDTPAAEVTPDLEETKPLVESVEPSDESVQKTGLCCWGGGSKKKKPGDERKKGDVTEPAKPLPEPETETESPLDDGGRVTDEPATEEKEKVYTVMPSLVNHSTSRSMFQRRSSSSEHLKCDNGDNTNGGKSNNSTSPQSEDVSKSNALSIEDPSLRECNVPTSALVPDVVESLGYPCDQKVFDDQVLLYNVMSDIINLTDQRDLDAVGVVDEEMSQRADASPKVVSDPSYETIVKSFGGWPYSNNVDNQASLMLQEKESQVSSHLLSGVETTSASTSTTALRTVNERRNGALGHVRNGNNESEPTLESKELKGDVAFLEYVASLTEEINVQRTSKTNETTDGNAGEVQVDVDQSEQKGTDVKEKIRDEAQSRHMSTGSLESETESISELPERIRRFTSQELKLASPNGLVLPKSSFNAKDLKKQTKEK